jgi:hypothetical protein
MDDRDHGNAGNPRVFPPGSSPFGMSYGEWLAEFFAWVFNIPPENNPSLDLTGEFCGVEQSGPVWYLAPPVCFAGPCDLTRNLSCEVPAGKILFVPMLAAGASVLTGEGQNAEELLAYVNGVVDQAVVTLCEVDGVPIHNTHRYRDDAVVTVVFDEDNLLELPSGTSTLAAFDGISIMIPPLPPGQHTIHYAGNLGDILEEDVTWNLTVVPDDHTTVMLEDSHWYQQGDGYEPAFGTWGRLKTIYR